jgi:hypothetical protein
MLKRRQNVCLTSRHGDTTVVFLFKQCIDAWVVIIMIDQTIEDPIVLHRIGCYIPVPHHAVHHRIEACRALHKTVAVHCARRNLTVILCMGQFDIVG